MIVGKSFSISYHIAFLISMLACVGTSVFHSLFTLQIFRADEEPVDQKKYLEDSCKPKCVKPFLNYQVLGIILEICS